MATTRSAARPVRQLRAVPLGMGHGRAMLVEALPYSGDNAVGEGSGVGGRRGPLPGVLAPPGGGEMRAGRNRARRVLLAECFTACDTLLLVLRGFSFEDRIWSCLSQSVQPAAGKQGIADYRGLQRAGIMRETGGRKRKCPIGQMP